LLLILFPILRKGTIWWLCCQYFASSLYQYCYYRHWPADNVARFNVVRVLSQGGCYSIVKLSIWWYRITHDVT